MDKTDKIYVAGHTGMVGSALVRKLTESGYRNLIYSSFPPNDLTDQNIVASFFRKEKPDYVLLAAAKVGGIMANNSYRAQFIYENLMIQNNIIHQSYVNGVKKLLFLGSSCIYPKSCPQPIKEEYLLTGELEYTNEPYAIAKIAGVKMCEAYNLQYGTDFLSVMPTNLYGPNDNYDLETSHVLPAMIRKMHLGKCLENNDWVGIRKDINKRPIKGLTASSSNEEIQNVLFYYGITGSGQDQNSVKINLWGTGNPYREFLYVDELADACVYLMNNINFKDLCEYNSKEKTKTIESALPLRYAHINIGTGSDLTIKELASLLKKAVGFRGQINWDKTKPDGTPRKLLDVGKLNHLGWKGSFSLEDGIKRIYNEYSS